MPDIEKKLLNVTSIDIVFYGFLILWIIAIIAFIYNLLYQDYHFIQAGLLGLVLTGILVFLLWKLKKNN